MDPSAKDSSGSQRSGDRAYGLVTAKPAGAQSTREASRSLVAISKEIAQAYKARDFEALKRLGDEARRVNEQTFTAAYARAEGTR
jgi:hypothetical protein